MIPRAGIVTEGRPLNVSGCPRDGWMASSLSRNAMCAAPIVRGAVPKALLRMTRTLEPPMVARTICRSVWFVKCVKGGAAKVVPAGGVTEGLAAGGGGAGHALRMNGAGPGGFGGGGLCGRPISAVAHVPTHRSLDCACVAGASATVASVSAINVPRRIRRCSLNIERVSFFRRAGTPEHLLRHPLYLPHLVVRSARLVMKQP